MSDIAISVDELSMTEATPRPSHPSYRWDGPEHSAVVTHCSDPPNFGTRSGSGPMRSSVSQPYDYIVAGSS